jgi:hypothetical protein
MENMELNIQKYTNKELEEILFLNYPYTKEDIVKNQHNVKNNINSNKKIDNQTKKNLIFFIDNILNRLVNNDQLYNSPLTNYKNSIDQEGSNFIIKKQSEIDGEINMDFSNGLIADLTGAPPGILNPINYRTIKRALNIDSKFRPNYYKTISTDMQIQLPYKFENVINMRLSSFEIPLTYYAISKKNGNNKFFVEWSENQNTDENGEIIYDKKTVVTIPDGNYEQMFIGSTNAYSIEIAINNALSGTDTFKAPFNLRFTVDRVSGRSIFSQSLNNSTEPIPYKITFNISNNDTLEIDAPLPFKLGWNLGFRVASYNCPNGESVVSEGICYVTGPKYIYLAIDDYNNNVNNYFISAFNDSIDNKNIIARLNIATISQNNGIYQLGQDDGFSTQINRSRSYFGPVDISKMRVTLYDEYGRILDLNNMDWSLALMFECIYS